MFMFNSNEPIQVAHLQKFAKQSMLNGALVTEMVILLGKAGKTLARNVLMERRRLIARKSL